MTKLNLEALEAKAKAATPGEWQANPVALKADTYTITTDERHVLYAAPGEVKCGRAGDYYECRNHTQSPAIVRIRTEDADYIAAANPATMLALIARIRELEAREAEVRNAADGLSQLLLECVPYLEPHRYYDWRAAELIATIRSLKGTPNV